MVKIHKTGQVYCWDVLGNPSFPSRVTALGLRSVTLAAAYHAVRAATPLHPRHQLVDARHSALYRPLRPSAWRTRRLRPHLPGWTPSPDPFGEAAAVLHAAGLSVTAWVVLAHNSRLGEAHPDVTVVNCFGERYPYALCPSHPEVRDYAATLAAEAVRDAPVDAVALESCGQMGLAHAGHHDKTAGAWPPLASRWLSVCCCPACRTAWTARGADPLHVVAQLRSAVRSTMDSDLVVPGDSAIVEDVDGAERGELPAAEAELILAVRQEAAASLRGQVVAGLGGLPVVLHGSADPWATGPSPGLPAGELPGVDAVLVNAWAIAPPSARETAARDATAASGGAVAARGAIAGVAAAVAAGHRTYAYVTALPPAEPARVPEHARALVAAGASGIHLYHLGLASAERLAALRTTIEHLEAS